MQKFTTHTGIVAPLNLVNVDTDAIIPKQFLKSIKKSGFGINLFNTWRYLDTENSVSMVPNPDFILNQPPYNQATVLLTGENFGCGSSREHAPWALLDFGFRAIIAESFADIFYNNSFKNGLLLIRLEKNIIENIFNLQQQAIQKDPTIGFKMAINLPKQKITTISVLNKFECEFVIDQSYKKKLIAGLDEIGVTLKSAATIKEYEARRRLAAPWLFRNPNEIV